MEGNNAMVVTIIPEVKRFSAGARVASRRKARRSSSRTVFRDGVI
jgi:hypothetical protein